ncbi:MAG: response regulator [Candidatus Nitrosocosmicus sp.]|jgi:two-component SAPR family response regulator|uniref:response regulator n=1 Tax=Candidatus Nitrosocosmicus agrestis TaxID=2563600 RepID=UPI00122E603C|nr:response regulator [Candidatus Nitrosocosmicus sp. SS]KAF0867538.1 response regulator [Candidatus Nitrosocosmicus sp. SS]
MGLEHFGNNYDKVHLIITDLKMPKLNGIELANKVRECSKTVKILLITTFVVDMCCKLMILKRQKLPKYSKSPFTLRI